MRTFYISDANMKKILSDEAYHFATLRSNPVFYHFNIPLYEVKMTEKQIEDALIPNHKESDSHFYFNVKKMRTFNLDYQFFYLPDRVGSFINYKPVNSNFTLNTPKVKEVVKKLISENLNRLRPLESSVVCCFALCDEKSMAIFAAPPSESPISTIVNPSKLASTVIVKYHFDSDEFTIETVLNTESGNFHFSPLEDLDDPHLTIENIPELLLRLKEILDRKNEAWNTNNEII